MHFLPDMYVPCDICHGKRYNRETLEIRYKGKTIYEVLEMTVEQALAFFNAVPIVARKLDTLMQVGLGYIRLGQSATTLSGGEAQRVKLALELSKRDTGRTLYILDEPTTGLHFADIECCSRCSTVCATTATPLSSSNTISTSSRPPTGSSTWAPRGRRGGMVVGAGSPEELACNPASHTGRYLTRQLKPRPSPEHPGEPRPVWKEACDAAPHARTMEYHECHVNGHFGTGLLQEYRPQHIPEDYIRRPAPAPTMANRIAGNTWDLVARGTSPGKLHSALVRARQRRRTVPVFDPCPSDTLYGPCSIRLPPGHRSSPVMSVDTSSPAAPAFC
jgi:hypothetical protein